MLEKGLIDPSALIAKEFGLEDALQAFEHAARAGVLKVLVTP
jgi:threonine dehydrogenase-like Zn-dependent dehydrogenase